MNIMAGQWWLLLLLADRGETTLTIRPLVLAPHVMPWASAVNLVSAGPRGTRTIPPVLVPVLSIPVELAAPTELFQSRRHRGYYIRNGYDHGIMTLWL